MKVVYFGSSGFSMPPLKALYEAGESIGLVVTQPDKVRGRGRKVLPTPVKAYAEEHGLPVIQPERIRGDEDVTAAIRDANPDIAVVASYGKILPKEILEMPKLGCFNLHASLLPKLRGAAPVPWAVDAGEKVTGVTLMYMGEGLDDGDIAAAVETPIDESEDTGTLLGRLADMAARLLIDKLPEIADGSLPRSAQDGRFATYARMLTKEDGHLDFKQDAAAVVRRFRAMTPSPGAYVVQGENRIKILKAMVPDAICGGSTASSSDIGSSALPSPPREPAPAGQNESYVASVSADPGRHPTKLPPAPGAIISVSARGIEVQAGSGTVLITEIGWPGKKPMPVSEFIKGNRIDGDTPFS
ncbi:MAG: methionyl-tRNA formyltransferase [Clostridiales Family XIII bacterium]|jgi:methionyl-tRNA formyltransferase|nr:methionyl-tRNA formyltransferase [Clostridiales Family XIII bacterium]